MKTYSVTFTPHSDATLTVAYWFEDAQESVCATFPSITDCCLWLVEQLDNHLTREFHYGFPESL